ncbi:MarR family transcriptional regulator [Bradyrhizobium elkanii]|uniref:MarR family transcriptional regulator n=1 Tax=Bradyrhizobium elkanii TaxID=29448 RepID=UPI0004B3A100|nr:helix-turn-helix domain-containing protein [Bradyrhizobium elkanii]
MAQQTKKLNVMERQRQSAVVADMMLTIVAAMQRDYRRKHIGASFEELLVAMAVRRNDNQGKPPINVAALEKVLNVPRSNVSRAVATLIRHQGIIRKVDHAYTGNPAYLAPRVDAAYFTAIREAIITAAHELQK